MWRRISQGGMDGDPRREEEGEGETYHYLQVKPVADALHYTEQKRNQNGRKQLK